MLLHVRIVVRRGSVGYFFAGYKQEHTLLQEEKQAVPYVMEAIGLLFVAWFMEQNDIKCVEDAVKIYQFVEQHVERILQTVDCKQP